MGARMFPYGPRICIRTRIRPWIFTPTAPLTQRQSDYSGFSGKVVNRRCFYLLPALIAVVMLVSGCGTTKPSDSGDRTGNQPWVLLTSAEVEQVKSLAMGAAVTKGWKITDASGDKLLIRRPLSTTQAKAFAGEPVSKAAVEVRTDFDKRRTGVAVGVAAAMVADKITGKGKKSPIRVDVTDSYRKELSHSLSALRRSWGKNRRRIAAAMRPLPTRDTVSEDEDTEDTSGASAGGKVNAAASSPSEKTTATPIAALRADNKAITAAAPSTHSRPAPVEDRILSKPHSVRSSTPDRAMTAAAPSTCSRPAPVEDRAPSRRVAGSGMRNGTSRSPSQPMLGRQLIDATSDTPESGLRWLRDLQPLRHFSANRRRALYRIPSTGLQPPRHRLGP